MRGRGRGGEGERGQGGRGKCTDNNNKALILHNNTPVWQRCEGGWTTGEGGHKMTFKDTDATGGTGCGRARSTAPKTRCSTFPLLPTPSHSSSHPSSHSSSPLILPTHPPHSTPHSSSHSSSPLDLSLALPLLLPLLRTLTPFVICTVAYHTHYYVSYVLPEGYPCAFCGQF